MEVIVQKYGGSSIADLNKIKAAAENIKNTADSGLRVVVVVSAMGHYTDELLKMANELSNHPSSREVDVLLSAGERISMALLSIALHQLNIDSISLTGSQCGILTDGIHGNAKIKEILGDRIKNGLKENKVVIVAGFQGVDPQTKEITTLGRGGSDLTAVALGAKLAAVKVELYKDVAGVMSADPKAVKNAKKIAEVDYKTMNLLATCGASIVHNRSIHLARKYELPITIRSTFNLNEPGTKILGVLEMENPVVKAVTTQNKLVHLQLKYKGEHARGMALADVLSGCWAKGLITIINRQASLNDNTIVDIFVPMDKADNILTTLTKQTRDNRIQLESHRFQEKNLSSISIIGNGFNQAPELVVELSKIIESPKVVTMNITDDQITYILEKADLKTELNQIHQKFVDKQPS